MLKFPVLSGEVPRWRRRRVIARRLPRGLMKAIYGMKNERRKRVRGNKGGGKEGLKERGSGKEEGK